MGWNKEAYVNTGGIALYNIWLATQMLENYKKQGCLDKLLPSLNFKFNLQEVDKYMEKLEYEWDMERSRRTSGFDYTCGFPFTQLPVNAKIWTYEVITKYREEVRKEIERMEEQIEGEVADYYGHRISL